MNEYLAQGFATRSAYLRSLADDYSVPARTVFMLASMLGPNEDFDGLISELEDLEASGDFD